MKKIIIYGGAFNPPTKAHQQILQTCVNKAAEINADVILLPSGDRKDKIISTATSSRLSLVTALEASVSVSGSVSIRIETTELERSYDTETYDTYRLLRHKYPEAQLIWLFGSDSVRTMPEWHHGQWLFDHLSMLIIPRPGYSITSMPPHASLLPIYTKALSSTEVRQKLSSGQQVEELVPHKVFEILIEQSLFQSTPK